MKESSQGENSNPQERFCAAREALRDKKVSAIILAAGFSRRMGALKPILKLGDKTILERAIRLFRDLGIEDVIVVVGHGANADCSNRS